MVNETKAPTPANAALLRSNDYVPAEEIHAITKMVPDFAARYADDYFEDRSASRTRKNILTGGILFLCFAIGISLIVGAISGQPAHLAITSLTALLNAAGGAFLYLTNRN